MTQLATVEEVASTMFDIIARAHHIKKISPAELIKSADRVFGTRSNKQTNKLAIKSLIESGKCIYAYYGTTTIDIADDKAAIE